MSEAYHKAFFIVHHQQSKSSRTHDECKLLENAFKKANPDENLCNDGKTLAEHLCLAVQNNNIGAVRWMLEACVNPCMVPKSQGCLLDYALTETRLNTGLLEIAVLLRKHGMPLADALEEAAREWISYYSAPHKMRWPHNRRIIRQLQDLVDPHREEPGKVACYTWASFCATDDPAVVPSWSTPRVEYWPPTSAVSGSTHMPMLKHWEGIRALRCAEARVLAPFNWKRLRVLIKMRGVAFYWLEETQKGLCAPGGAGRAEDLAAYRDAFA